MNRSTELNIIDYSILKTMSRGGDYSCFENAVAALLNYTMYNNPNGFTRLDNARNYIMSLSIDDIEKELLKNIVKKDFCSRYNHYACKLGTRKNFGDELDISDAEVLIFNAICTMHMDAVNYIIKKYPELTDLMIKSFVDSRYFNSSYKIEKLEDEKIITDECAMLLKKIDDYYYQKQNSSVKLSC